MEGKTRKAEREILAALASNSPLTKAELAEMTNYAATGGGFNNALGRLRTLELIVGSATLAHQRLRRGNRSIERAA